MSTSARIRAELLVGPMTSAECADAISAAIRITSAHMNNMRKLGHVSVYGAIDTGGPIPANIWQLTPRGRYMAIREARKTKTVHNVPVSTTATAATTQPIPMISGHQTPNKTLKPASAAPAQTGQERVLQTVFPAPMSAMGETF